MLSHRIIIAVVAGTVYSDLYPNDRRERIFEVSGNLNFGIRLFVVLMIVFSFCHEIQAVRLFRPRSFKFTDIGHLSHSD